MFIKSLAAMVLAAGVLALGATPARASTISPAAPHAAVARDATHVQTDPNDVYYFSVQNTTDKDMWLSRATINYSSWLDGGPVHGSIIKPGMTATYGMLKRGWDDVNAVLSYDIGDESLLLTYDSWGKSFTAAAATPDWKTSTTFSAWAGGTASNPILVYTYINPRTFDIPTTQGQLQADALRGLCGQTGSVAQCTFQPSSTGTVRGRLHDVTDVTNTGPTTVELGAGKTDTVTVSDSVGIDLTAEVGIEGIVSASVQASYHHSVDTSVGYLNTLTMPVQPGWYGEIDGSVDMIQDIGDFTVTLGNATWHLHDIAFQFPTPGSADHFTSTAHKLQSGS